jgi:hypothetical protein
MRRVADTAVTPADRGRRITIGAALVFWGLMSVGLIGFGVIAASWGGLQVEALLLMLTGSVMTAICVAGWSVNRSGRTPWGLIAALPISFGVLIGLLAVIQ